jgi:hypothetical protein
VPVHAREYASEYADPRQAVQVSARWSTQGSASISALYAQGSASISALLHAGQRKYQRATTRKAAQVSARYYTQGSASISALIHASDSPVRRARDTKREDTAEKP